MPMIRSITYHARVNLDNVGEALRSVEGIVSRLREAVNDLGIRVWELRVALPPIKDVRSCDAIATRFAELADDMDMLVAALHTNYVRRRDIVQSLVKSIAISDKLYASSLAQSLDDVKEYVEALYQLHDVGDALTRYAIVFPNRPVTPYLPVASYGGVEGLSIGLRYADLLLEAISRNELKHVRTFFEKVREVCIELSRELSTRCIGIDVSPSPWMDESVCRVLELLSRTEFPRPGIGWAIAKLNKLVLDLARKAGLNLTGFNEVMLPIAEDNLLKKRVVENSVSLSTIARLTPYSVAGLDLAAFSVDDDRDVLKNILTEVFVAAEIKSKPLGVRLIPSTGSPGTSVKHRELGDIPIMRLV